MARVLHTIPACKNKRIREETDGGKANDSSTVQLDKFKRRLVRAVARLRQQKLEDEAIWQKLKTEIGCDCKNLWQQMRALTMKKLKRLLPANDMLEGITKVARLTATDWLLFDLILVHENIDVISLGEPPESAEHMKREEEPDCLEELFELVKHHDVEILSGDELLEAWIRITLEYNSKGRQTSPMMLQLRWHQLKELSRAGFYNFWYSYRGNPKFLSGALSHSPSKLQTDVVKEFNKVVIKEFLPWDTMIQKKRVILSEEFTQFREAKRKAEKTPEKETELELIEPQVETIDLDGVESDRNSIEKNKTNELANLDENTSCHIVKVKSEPVDDVVELESFSDHEMQTAITGQNIQDNIESICENEAAVISHLDEIDDDGTLPTITSVIGNAVEVDKTTSDDEINEILEEKAKNLIQTFSSNGPDTDNTSETTSCDVDDEMNEILREKVNSLKNVEITKIKSEYDSEHTASDENNLSVEILDDEAKIDTNTSNIKDEAIQCDSDDEMDRLLQEKAEQFMNTEVPQIKSEPIFSNDSKKSDDSVKSETATDIIIPLIVEDDSDENKEEKINDASDEAIFDDNGIEFVDDGIEFVDDNDGKEDKNDTTQQESDSDTEDKIKDEDADNANIDLKLLMDPIVYTKKLDLMEVFNFTDYYSVSDKRVIECALSESKPVDKRALKEEDLKKFREQVDPDYKADVSEDKDIIQTTKEIADDRVKITSWLLQKPKNRTYNPIMLCKNPDFNTRLKRLTAGFHSLTSNREHLKECKPLTIDLHKAFESRLVDGTLYLKAGNFKHAPTATVLTDKSERPDLEKVQQKFPLPIIDQIVKIEPNVGDTPTPVTAQGFDDRENSKLQQIQPIDRRKVINLPDINQVRLVNQSLLTAEVTPIRVANKSDFSKDKEPATVTSTETKVTPIIAGVIKNDLESTESYITINQIQNKTASNLEKKKNMKPPKKSWKKPKSTDDQQKKATSVSNNNNSGIWKPNYVKNYFADSLLTIDTLNRILYLIKEDEESIAKSKEHKTNRNDKKSSSEANSTSMTKPNEAKVENSNKVGIAKLTSQMGQKKRNKRAPRKYKGIYCCWAREKIFLGLKRPLKKHGCIKFECTCCCRAELNVNHTRKYINEGHFVKKKSASSTIVLSDDEERTEKDLEIVDGTKQCDPSINLTTKGTSVPVTVTAGVELPENQQNSNPDILTKQLKPNTLVTPSIVIRPVLQHNLLIPNSDISSEYQNEQGSINAQAISSYPNTMRNKCKTLIKSAKGHPYNENAAPPELTPKELTPEERTSSNILYPPAFPSELKMPKTMVMKSSEIKNQPATSPIFLGKNKVLLCSFKKNKTVELPCQLPVLPNGLNFLLLPTGELTLSIAPGVQLDAQQASMIPALMAIVEAQLDKIRIGNQTLIDVSNQQQVRNTATKQNVIEQPNTSSMLATESDSTQTKKQTNPVVSPQNLEICSQNPPYKINIGQEGVAIVKPNALISSGDATINKVNDLETNADGLSEKSSQLNQADIDSQQERQTVESHTRSSYNGVSMLKQMLESPQRGIPDTPSNNADDKNINSRKTILSDLMEMSGISAEDTNMVTDVSMDPTSMIPESSVASNTLSPIVIPLTKPLNVSNTESRTEINKDVPENVSITGQYTNLFTFSPTNSTNYLLNCLGYLRPELNAVITFADLKYACENDGEFFKLQVDTGVISPINVCIKKSFKTLPTIIDLTDDVGDEVICTQEDQAQSNDKETPNFSFQVVNEKKDSSTAVKPIKLFKSFRPGILRHYTKSIIKKDQVKSNVKADSGKAFVYKTNISHKLDTSKLKIDGKVRVCKVNNKIIQVVNSKKVEVPPVRYFDTSGDSSDDEPLAKKSKRIKESENNSKEIENTEVLEPVDEDMIEEEIASVPEIPVIEGDNDDDASDVEMNGPEIQGVNPELHSVAFEEDSDSADDMCILGV